MRKFFLGLLSATLALAVSTAQAGTVRLTGDIDGVGGAKADGGIINVVMDLDAEDTLSAGGGIDFALVADTAGVIEFTSAAIGEGAWDIKTANISGGTRVQMNTTALFQTGLPQGAQDVVIATINYSVLNADGATSLSWSLPEVAAVVDGTNGTDPDRSSAYAFEAGSITLGGPIIPEPGTLCMAGMGLVGLVLRRRNG